MWLSLIIFICLIILPRYIQFRLSSYRKLTNTSFFETFLYRKNYSNYATIQRLEKLYPNAYFLVNLPLYISNKSLETIPLLMITDRGIFIFTPFLDRGMISGDTHGKSWIVTHSAKTKIIRRKNPIVQNGKQINQLQNILNRYPMIEYFSFITLHDHARIENITIDLSNYYVLKRHFLPNQLKEIEENEVMHQLSLEQQKDIYTTLKTLKKTSYLKKRSNIIPFRLLKKEKNK